MKNIIVVDKSAWPEILKMLNIDTKGVNIDDIAAITKEGIIKKDLISLIELSDKIKEE